MQRGGEEEGGSEESTAVGSLILPSFRSIYQHNR
jgi:hypothetical protein